MILILIIKYLLASLTLGDPFSSNFDLWLAETFQQLISIDPHQISNLVGKGHVISLSLVITTFLLEFHFSHVHDTSSQLVTIPFLIIREANNIKSVVSELQLFIVINGLNTDLAHGDITVVIDVISKQAFHPQVSNKWLQKLIEDVVRPLNLLLLSDAGLLQKVGLNVTTSQFSSRSEVDTNEFAKT